MKQVAGILVASCVLLTSCSYKEGPPRYNTVMGTPRHPELNGVSDEGIPFAAKPSKPVDKYDEPLELSSELSPELPEKPLPEAKPASEPSKPVDKAAAKRKVPVENLVEQDQTPNSVDIPVVKAQNMPVDDGKIENKSLSPQLSLAKEAQAQFAKPNDYPKLNSVPDAPANSKAQAASAKNSIQSLENERKISEDGRNKLALEHKADMAEEKPLAQPVPIIDNQPLNTSTPPKKAQLDSFKPVEATLPKEEPRKINESKPVNEPKKVQEVNPAPIIATTTEEHNIQAVPVENYVPPMDNNPSENSANLGNHNQYTGGHKPTAILPESRYNQRRASQNNNPNIMYH